MGDNTHVFYREGQEETSGRDAGWPECEAETFWRTGRRILPQMWWDETDDILRHVVQLLVGKSAASVRIDHQLIQMISRGRETKHPSFSSAESTTEERNNCYTAQAAGGCIITSLGVSIHCKYNIWSHECVIPDINTIKLNLVFTRLQQWNAFNLLPHKAHTQQWALKMTYRHNTNGVAFTRTGQIIGPLCTDAGEGLHTYACAHVHTNYKFTCKGELKIPTLLTPNPKVHWPTSNNPNFIEIPEHCPLTWTEPSPRLVIFRKYFQFMLGPR